MKKHTKAPWNCKLTPIAGQYSVGEAIRAIGEEDAANASLISAAPDLLDALEQMLSLDGDDINFATNEALIEAAGSSNKDISFAAKAYLAARRAVAKATQP